MSHGKHGEHGKLLFEDETFRIQGAVFEVSRVLGTGFLEAVYQEALAFEFETRGIPFVASPSLAISYKDRLLNQTYRPDFICFDHVIVELKAIRETAPEHRAQTLNYLRATGLKVGLLVNFGCAPKARVERLVL
ncbi:MAG TPA: GxxExxY protein [Caulobacteraceae bacterium]|jgi:GxxExxY protein|nr:GxxExxY protein [Caulobacteraceae bacterium]